MTIHLPEDVETAIQAEVLGGRFASGDDLVAAAVRDYLERRREPAVPPDASAAEPARKPVWERILERAAAIPDAEWDKLPTDLAEQHDHYLHGSPKRPPS